MKKLNEAGQGTIEYILVLTVTVLIIMSLIWQFNTAFKKYADAFFDGYIACLLETGELPGGGGECTADLQKFEMKNGTSLAGGGGSGGGGGGSGGNGSGSNDGKGNGSGSGGKGGNTGSSTKAAKNSGGDDSGGGGSGGGGSGSELGGSGGGNSVFARTNRGKQRSTAMANTKAAGASGKGREPLTALGSVDANSGGSSSGRAKKTSLDRSFGFFGQEDESEKALTAPSTAVAKDDGSSALKPKSVAMSLTRKTASVDLSQDEGFTLGKFVRILLITAIVVMILIFFGGQILQISKSAEK